MLNSAITLLLTMMLVAPEADTRLADAAMNGNQVVVQSLLKQKADVNAAQGDGNTALHWAAYRDDLEMARLLLDAGASIKAKTRLGDFTPLHLAATNGSAPMIELLVKAGADINAANGNGTTALMLAAASGSTDGVRILLDRGADPNARDTTNGQTAVMFAAGMNRVGAIELLVQRGASLAATTRVSEVKPNGSDRQVNGGGESRVRTSTRVGGNAALHFAAREGHLDATRALTSAGADVNQLSGAADAMTPLVQAIINGHFGVAKYLLEQGADPNAPTKVSGVTPLWAAIDARYAPRAWYPSPNTEQQPVSHLDLIRELLARKADPNARLVAKPWFRTFGDSNQPEPAGATPFYRAAQANDLPAMELLLAAGADPNLPTNQGTTPLLVAAGLQQDFQGANFAPEARLETIRFLVENHAADVNAADNRGYSVLHAAAFVGRNDIVEYLVARGADVRRRANQISNGPSMQAAKPGLGDTVADMANGWTEKTLQFPETVTLLIKLGSDFSNTCWASVCVNPTRPDKKP